MRRLFLAPVIVLLLGLAACGSLVSSDASDEADEAAPASHVGAEGEATSAPTASPDEGGAASEEPPDPTEPPASTPAEEQNAQGAPSPGGETPNEGGEQEQDFEMTVAPACVRRGDTVTIEIETVPFADIAYGVAFSDGKSHENYGIGRADADGRFTHSFVVPPDAAYGEADVMATAKDDRRRGGSGHATFEVAERGSC